MRHIDYLEEEGKTKAMVLKQVARIAKKKLARGIERKLRGAEATAVEAGVELKGQGRGPIGSGTRPQPVKKNIKAVVREDTDPSDKLPGLQAQISGITKQLTGMRKNWDRNSDVLRRKRKELSSTRDDLVGRAKQLARTREAEQKATKTGGKD